MEKKEIVGNVALDYEFYSGEDYYSEGDIEDELLKIVQSNDEDGLYTLINTKNKWEYLYHFSQFRKNIVDWIPFTENAKILEIGSGCGAITGALAEKGKQVDCVELSRRRSLINANRNKKYENIVIKIGNFEKIEPYLDKDYDVITLIGVWEYAGVYLSSKEPFGDFLDLLKKHIKSNGKIVIAIENRFGLKYWAGCREDHTGMFFEGLEGYTKSNGAVTLGKNEMTQLFYEKGYYSQFYYPYPDYKIPFQIFSDDYLPKPGMLTDNGKNFDNSRMVLFDEEKVYDSIIKNNMFSFFSNSFLVILSKTNLEKVESKVVYSKYSNERVNCFQIRTDIIKDISGDFFVCKTPLNETAKTHIQNIYKMYKVLKANNTDEQLKYNKCLWMNDTAKFEYIEGKSAGDMLETYLSVGKKQEAKALIDEIVKIIQSMQNTNFRETQDFVSIFGHCPLEGVPAVNGADIDITFENVIYREGVWNIIDYEWSYDFSIPVNYIIYRLLYDQAPEEIKKWNLCEKYGMSKEEQSIYFQMERHFMEEYVYKNRYVLSGSQIIKPKFVINDATIKNRIETGLEIKVYYDYGEGLSEMNTSYFSCVEKEKTSLNIPINKEVKSIRIDPMECAGIVNLIRIQACSDEEDYTPFFNVNGVITDKNYILYNTSDPWIHIPDIKEGTKSINIEMIVDKVSSVFLEESNRQYNRVQKELEIKIYFDCGTGLSESNTSIYHYKDNENIQLDIPLTDNITGLRIDPMECEGIIRIKNLTAIVGEETYDPIYEINGDVLEKHCYIFDTEDPWIYLTQLKEGTNSLHVELSLDKISKETIKKLRSYLKKMPKRKRK